MNPGGSMISSTSQMVAPSTTAANQVGGYFRTALPQPVMTWRRLRPIAGAGTARASDGRHASTRLMRTHPNRFDTTASG